MTAAFALAVATLGMPAPVPRAGMEALPSLSVEELYSRRFELDGRRVRVTGWLGPCSRKRCRIENREGGGGRGIWIGRSAAFDRRAARLGTRWVTVEARVMKRCFGADLVHTDDERGTILFIPCAGRTGRAAQLANPKIIAVHAGPPPFR